jgi:hypothetical protein
MFQRDDAWIDEKQPHSDCGAAFQSFSRRESGTTSNLQFLINTSY